MKLKQTEEADISIDMSPMIDMVFLLLIFFIVASVMVDLPKAKVNLPTASAAKVPDEIKGRLSMSVDTNEQFYIGLDPVTLDQLKEKVGKELELNPELRVFIRSDEGVPFRINKKLMTACAEMGAINLIYAAYED